MSGLTGPHAVTNVPDKGDYCYDFNGNMTSGDDRTVQYSAFNKPTRIQKGSEVTQLHYGPSRQRYKRIDTGSQNRTTYYMGAYEKEIRGGKTYHRIQLGDFAIVQKIDNNAETIQYTLRDDLGTLIATVSETGSVKRLNFDPWGKRLDLPVAKSQSIDLLSLQNFVTDRGFTGHEHLDGSGLIHMNGRVYDPVIARFISADPLIQAPGYLQSYNRYSYVWNNPLRYTDPSGFSTEGKSGWEKTKDFFSKAWNEAKARVRELVATSKAKSNGTYDPRKDRWNEKYLGESPYYDGDDPTWKYSEGYHRDGRGDYFADNPIASSWGDGFTVASNDYYGVQKRVIVSQSVDGDP